MTRILCFSDLHDSEQAIVILKKKFKKYGPELVVCAGDLTTFGIDFSKTINKMNFGVPFLIIPGNHEMPRQIESASRQFSFIQNIHNSFFIFKNLFFFGIGGSNITPFNTPFEMNEHQIKENIKKAYEKIKEKIENRKLILISHTPPFKTKLDRVDSSHVGSIAIRRFIEKFQPILNICGHIHENEELSDRIKKTRVINPGSYGKIIELK
ncbi:metallophosphoesterase [Candidatus Pacearchaeota archaeon CG06_land_8_20_14_3_00_35_12]|nr:MAG: metallophosphoesterase [Candidatus Pacearchaeota archaeon CG06_land_8_20_14_3_00_35_12]